MHGQADSTMKTARSHDSTLLDEFKILEKAYRRILPRGGDTDVLWDDLVDVLAVEDGARVRCVHMHECSSSGMNDLVAYEIEGAADGLYVIPKALNLHVRVNFFHSSIENKLIKSVLGAMRVGKDRCRAILKSGAHKLTEFKALESRRR